MKKIFLQLCILGSIGFLSCNETESASAETTSEQQESENLLLNTQPASPGANAATPASVVGQPAKVDQAAKPSTQAAKTAATVNPAHGEPGHRCDIPVGAPLDGSAPAPGNNNNIQMQAAPQQAAPAATPAMVPASTPSTGKVNPPHGQPGHDCAKPVGAPL